MERKLFSEISPACYKISVKKEIIKRNLKNKMNKDVLAKEKSESLLPNIVKEHSSILLRRLEGVDMTLQYNKVNNIELTCKKIDGLIIKPGETFSFWTVVGPTTEKNGYKEGLIIDHGKLTSGTGGGLCQMANLIHWMVLNSPCEVTEIHHHTDALFPDERRRVPFGTGTSIMYNYVDFRFKNVTDQNVQLHVFIDGDELKGQLRSESEFPFTYELVEEDHHFSKEGENYFRISKVYKLTYKRDNHEMIDKKLIVDNHSMVMYDHSLIPAEQIR